LYLITRNSQNSTIKAQGLGVGIAEGECQLDDTEHEGAERFTGGEKAVLSIVITIQVPHKDSKFSYQLSDY
jgi:hypothetical protein